MRRVDARSVIRARTVEERLRRHLYGESGATFSKGKYMTLGCHIMVTITTFITKDCLLSEIYETD